jgi:hypothetical protein
MQQNNAALNSKKQQQHSTRWRTLSQRRLNHKKEKNGLGNCCFIKAVAVAFEITVMLNSLVSGRRLQVSVSKR